MLTPQHQAACKDAASRSTGPSDLDGLMPFFRNAGVMEFPQMTLVGLDGEPAILEGAGRVDMPAPDKMIVHMTGRPEDLRHSLFALNRLQDHPYESRFRFRLQMTDTYGNNWSAWCEIERIEPDRDEWSLLGWTQGIIGTRTSGASPEAFAEARFLIPASFTARGALARIIRTESPDGTSSPYVVVDVLGCSVTLRYDVREGMIAASVPLSKIFPAPEAENWLGEPLRVLLGQQVYPRFVLRQFVNGYAQVHIRIAPGWSKDSRWTALWQPDQPDAEVNFLDLYRGLLTLVASDRPDERVLEEHKITSLYGEVIEAAKGSRWVMAFTLASSIEAVVTRISERSIPLNVIEQQAVDELKAYLASSSAPERILKRLNTSLDTLPNLSAANAMRELAKAGTIRTEGVKIWNRIRNMVMHGELVSPYSSEEDDRNLLELARLFHDLTREAVRRAFDNAPT